MWWYHSETFHDLPLSIFTKPDWKTFTVWSQHSLPSFFQPHSAPSTFPVIKNAKHSRVHLLLLHTYDQQWSLKKVRSQQMPSQLLSFLHQISIQGCLTLAFGRFCFSAGFVTSCFIRPWVIIQPGFLSHTLYLPTYLYLRLIQLCPSPFLTNDLRTRTVSKSSHSGYRL